jgi:calcineurin-like phosphoesterase family protein
MPVFFTSDTHFGHASIIKYCKRPFRSTTEMDEALLTRWNETVAAGDVVYHLGDICYRSPHGADYYLSRLNGEIHLIVGNHDGDAVKRHSQRFASVSLIKEIEIERQKLVLCHYPMREWPGAWQGAWHLYGHVHGRLDQRSLGHSLDVGVDIHDFRPVSFSEVKAKLEGRSTPFTDRM